MSKKAPAFLSYARVDSDFALRLAADLKAKGANVWMDQIDIRPGKQWDREVEGALGACSEMLVILSAKGVESSNVMDEVSYALEERKTVIPIIQGECRIPFRLRRLQRVDFRTDYTHGLQILLDTLVAENQVTAVQDAEQLTTKAAPDGAEAAQAEQDGNRSEKAEAAHQAEQYRIELETAKAARQGEQDRIQREKAEAARKAEQERIERETAAAALAADRAARQAEQDRIELEGAEAARQAEQHRIKLEKAAAARQAEQDRIQHEKADAARRAEQERTARERAAAALAADVDARRADREIASAASRQENSPATVQYATIVPDPIETLNPPGRELPRKPFPLKTYLIPAALAAVLILGLVLLGLWRSKRPSVVAQSAQPVTQSQPSTAAPAAPQPANDDFDSVLPHENQPPNDAKTTNPPNQGGQTPSSGVGKDKVLPPAGEPGKKPMHSEGAKPAVKKLPEMPVAQPVGPPLVGGSIMDTYLISKVTPVYPDVARQTRVQGAVEFVATISKDGIVSRLRLVRGHPLLIKSAESAVIQWKYRPYLINGRPTEVSTNVIVNFTLTPVHP